MNAHDAVLRAVDEALAEFHARVEEACEAAVQGGEHGVLIEWDGLDYRVSVSPEVPYGVIWERPAA